MNTIIVTGGNINDNFLKEYLLKNKFDIIIAADRGLDLLSKINVLPNYIIGDFDSVNKKILSEYERKKISITYLKPEKDYTDTHMALKQAISIGSNKITIIGATGTRIDHTLANINILKEALGSNIEAKIIDENNEILLIEKNKILKKNDRFKYVSILPFTSKLLRSNLRRF